MFRKLHNNESGQTALEAAIILIAFVVSMPGSTNAVQTALEKLILPEINHLAWEIVRKG